MLDPTIRSQPTVRAQAGEGGGLPKGLSLFRFILFSFLMLGAVYGGASLWFDAPPPPGDVPPRGVAAAQWQPSPLWLPSYIAIRLRIGVQPSAQGYVFSSRAGRAFFASSTIAIGILLLGTVGWFGGERIRRAAIQRRSRGI